MELVYYKGSDIYFYILLLLTRFQCANNLCVSQSDLCDATDDCGDGSDEAASICTNFNCDTLRRFQCDNHKCVPR